MNTKQALQGTACNRTHGGQTVKSSCPANRRAPLAWSRHCTLRPTCPFPILESISGPLAGLAESQIQIQHFWSLSKQARPLLERPPLPNSGPLHVWRAQRGTGKSQWVFQTKPGAQSCLFTEPETPWADQDTKGPAGSHGTCGALGRGRGLFSQGAPLLDFGIREQRGSLRLKQTHTETCTQRGEEKRVITR